MVSVRSAGGHFAFTLTRWIESQRQLPLIKELERQVSESEPAASSDSAPVLFFNASTRILGLSQNGAFSLLASWGFRLAGIPCIYYACDYGLPQCMLGTLVDAPYHSPPCRSCTYFTHRIFPKSKLRTFRYRDDISTAVTPQLADLSVDALAQFEYGGMEIGKLCIPSLRWALRRYSLVDDAPTRRLLRAYICGGINIARNFRETLSEARPRSVVLFNGQSYPEAVARQVALEMGVQAITHEVSLQPFSAFFSHGEATDYNIEIPDDFTMGEDQNRMLDAYLASRYQGGFSMAGIRFWPEIHELDENLIEIMDRYDQTVVVFTNVIFDTSQEHANVLFPNMFNWLSEVVRIAKSAPDTLFIIRAHPDEDRPGKKSRETVASKLEEMGAPGLPNVLHINPSEYVSSYELIKKSKFVMVYNSTVGLEASILGVPVLCAGRARFTPHNTVFFPSDQDDYRGMLESFLDAEKIHVPDAHKMNSRRFLYYQLGKASLDYSRFLQPIRRFPSQVRFRKFNALDLHPDRCAETAVLMRGILDGAPFLYPD